MLPFAGTLECEGGKRKKHYTSTLNSILYLLYARPSLYLRSRSNQFSLRVVWNCATRRVGRPYSRGNRLRIHAVLSFFSPPPDSDVNVSQNHPILLLSFIVLRCHRHHQSLRLKCHSLLLSLLAGGGPGSWYYYETRRGGGAKENKTDEMSAPERHFVSVCKRRCVCVCGRDGSCALMNRPGCKEKGREGGGA
jgi:hypothetical protein